MLRETAYFSHSVELLGAVLVIFVPNILLFAIQPNLNALRGGYYEIIAVFPSFLLYYSAVAASSMVLLVISVIKRSTVSGFAAYVLIGSSFFMPKVADPNWLTFRDILLHGSWITASTTHFAQIAPYNLWPGAWTVWLVVCHVLSIDPTDGSVVMLFADWMLRLAATLTLARTLIRQSGVGQHLSYALATVILMLFQNQDFILNTYFDSALAQSMSILLLCWLLRDKIRLGDLLIIVTLSIALVITHPFYAVVLSSVVVVLMLTSRFRGARIGSSNLQITILVLFILWITYSGGSGIYRLFSEALSGSSPHSVLLRTQTLQVLQPLPFYGVVLHQTYKYLILPAILVLSMAYLIRGRIPRTSKIVLLAFTGAASLLLMIFIFVPGFEGRVITFALFGLSALAGLEICELTTRSWMKRLPAIALLLLLVPVPLFLTLEPPVYTGTLTPSIIATVDFASQFPTKYYAVSPMDIYLRIVDPYLIHQYVIGGGSFTGSNLISPRTGVTFVLTVPPDQLGNNSLEMLSYSSAWNKSDRIYVSGGVVAYYSA